VTAAGSGLVGSDSGGSSNDGGSSDSSSPRRLAVRCRLNGSTPAAMVVKSRVRKPAVAATAAAAATAAITHGADVQHQQQQQHAEEAICLLDSD
jgi:hypothetical protein